jgi:hypothetical protein
MFTRDIALEDCVLDLVDNSIDALIRSREIDLEVEIGTDWRLPRPAHIDVQISSNAIVVADDCGGIPIEKAKHEVFIFGHSLPVASDLSCMPFFRWAQLMHVYFLCKSDISVTKPSMRLSAQRVSRVRATTPSVSPVTSTATPLSPPLSTMRFFSMRLQCAANAFSPPRK